MLALAACGEQSSSIPSSGMRDPAASTQAVESRPLSPQSIGVPAQARETVLYSFAGGSDGASIQTGLTAVDGVLYGTTVSGGEHNDGSVYEVTTSGAERVIYSFRGGSDGRNPYAGLLYAGDGVFYGTTAFGGHDNDGTVFKITTAGVETAIYRFNGGADGCTPTARLTELNGVLYGTTNACGANLYGTVFALTTAGEERVLYAFTGKNGDGRQPYAGLADIDGVLYGTTQYGGAEGNGTVYAITTSGSESVLHSFAGGNDGLFPYAGLTNVGGVLYGTTPDGGSHGYGVAYKITTSGVETVLHGFGGGSDGKYPRGGLTDVGGVLYGTTDEGGLAGKTGTVFKLTTSGMKSAVYRFLGGTDGAEPFANLTDLDGAVYGTTLSGGAHGDGTVFSVSL
jgi:uncharacterized repeat protein (TIGR03803 family)